jgi:hypothetical protein
MNNLSEIVNSRTPTLLKTSQLPLPPSEGNLLKAVGDALSAKKDIKSKLSLAFFINNKKQDMGSTEIINLLTPLGSETFETYNLRISDFCHNKDYILYISHIFTNDSSLWPWKYMVANLISDSFKNTIKSFNFDLFIGNYTKTPSQIHSDIPNVLYIQLLGDKTFHFWDDENIKKNSIHGIELFTKHNLEQRKINPTDNILLQEADHTIHNLVPGVSLFWPQRYWHMAKQPKNFTVSLSASWSNDNILDKSHEQHFAHLICPSPLVRNIPTDLTKSTIFIVNEFQFTEFFVQEGSLFLKSNGHSAIFPKVATHTIDSLRSCMNSNDNISINISFADSSSFDQIILLKIISFLYQSSAIRFKED